jgi:hypothetical protein
MKLDVLLSGVLGAVLAAVVALIASTIQNGRNRRWTLAAELRRYSVSRSIASINGLREDFFSAKTQLEYHLLTLCDLERQPTQKQIESTVGDLTYSQHSANLTMDVERRIEAETIRYNERVGRDEASAKAHFALLRAEFFPADLMSELGQLLEVLTTSITTNSESVRRRICLFEENETVILNLLFRLDQCVALEIIRKMKF